VPKEPSLGHGLAVAITGAPAVVKVVVVYVHPTHVTSVLVGPVTDAVSVVDWPKMSVFPIEELMKTEVTVAPLLLPPHPFKSKQGAMTASAR
jgi:hypothetical protein